VVAMGYYMCAMCHVCMCSLPLCARCDAHGITSGNAGYALVVVAASSLFCAQKLE
jgi:hypothetical protein